MEGISSHDRPLGTSKILKTTAVGLSLLSPNCRSDSLHPSPVPSKTDPRAFYLTRSQMLQLPPPLISCSEFVPKKIVELLMRRKKDTAIGVKFVGSKVRSAPASGAMKQDEITNMEGAMHTFVTPVVSRVEMIGDYRYDRQHGVTRFGDVVSLEERDKEVMLTRSVAMSASVHMDFENREVMLKVCQLNDNECFGINLYECSDWDVLSPSEKQDDIKRALYDAALRQHIIFHLTRGRKLEASSHVSPMTFGQTISFLRQIIEDDDGILEDKLVDSYVELRNQRTISLELLFNASLHQLRNELSALESLCTQGYIYTYDPPAIFGQQIGTSLLNRLMLAALKCLSDANTFTNMKAFAFNDYADDVILRLVRQALKAQSHVQVMSKERLFGGSGGKYKPEHSGGSILVVHNNSDGFGQNIETEGDYGSLDGAIGSNSSAAASLHRDRQDLLDYIF